MTEPRVAAAAAMDAGCVPDPTPESITASLDAVWANIRAAHQSSFRGQPEPRLVAVSKTKPPKTVLRAYEHGQRHFGENYVQELVEKSHDPSLAGLDICWHFIGHLQRNKCNTLVSVPGLWMVETVDSERLATALNNSWKRHNSETRLRIFIQVNVSSEEEKSGCAPDCTPAVVRHVKDMCRELQFCGLMMVGRIGHDYTVGPNPDFERLVCVKDAVCGELGLYEGEVELSMGMSADYHHAIAAGSSNVRIGSAIFGARKPNDKAQ